MVRFSGVLDLRYCVSRRERLAFSARISGVMKGLAGRDEQVMVLGGACLSRRVERTVSNS